MNLTQKLETLVRDNLIISKSSLTFSLVTIQRNLVTVFVILHQMKVNCHLTVLDSNFLEAILTLALRKNNIVSNQTEVGRCKETQNKDKDIYLPPLEWCSLLFFLPHHLWNARHM